jgi:hypothetical protein
MCGYIVSKHKHYYIYIFSIGRELLSDFGLPENGALSLVSLLKLPIQNIPHLCQKPNNKHTEPCESTFSGITDNCF